MEIRASEAVRRADALSAKDEGISIGTDRKTFKRAPEEIWGDDVRSLVEKARSHGIELIPIVGELELKDDTGVFTAKAAVREDGTKMWVRIDHDYYTASEIYLHEWVHFLLGLNGREQTVDALIAAVKKKFGRKAGRVMLKDLLDSYTAKYFLDENFNVTADDYYIYEEIFCDAYAGIDELTDAPGATHRAPELTDIVRRVVDSLKAQSRTEAGSTGTVKASRDYWRPKLTQAEWQLLNRNLKGDWSKHTHISDTKNCFYAKAKGEEVFAVYSTNYPEDPTILFAEGGPGVSIYTTYTDDLIWEVEHGTVRTAKDFGRWLKTLRRRTGRHRAGRSSVKNGGPAVGTGGLSGGQTGQPTGQQNGNAGSSGNSGTNNVRPSRDTQDSRPAWLQGLSIDELIAETKVELAALGMEVDDDVLLEDIEDVLNDVEAILKDGSGIEDISEERDIEPEVLQIIFRRAGLGDSHVENGKTAVMTADRIDRRIADSGASNPDYARRYITRISPKDFIDLTVTEKNLSRENFDTRVEGDSGSKMGDWDYSKQLRDSEEPPFLNVNITTGQIIGHNGRHRVRALEMAGIESVEIEVALYDEDGYLIKYNAKTIPDLAISSQFDTKIETHLPNIIPLNKAHRDEILANYGEQAHKDAAVRFSRDTGNQNEGDKTNGREMGQNDSTGAQQKAEGKSRQHDTGRTGTDTKAQRENGSDGNVPSGRGVDPRIDSSFGQRPLHAWAEQGLVSPKAGSVAEEEQRIAAEFGIPSFVVSDSVWEKNRKPKNGGQEPAPAFTAGDQIFLRETLPDKYRGSFAIHEVAHVMEYKKYEPYMRLVEETPGALIIGHPVAQALTEGVAEHCEVDPFDMKSGDEVRVYSEMNAVILGSLAVDDPTLPLLRDAFFDFDAHIAKLRSVVDSFKRDNTRFGRDSRDSGYLKTPDIRFSHDTKLDETARRAFITRFDSQYGKGAAEYLFDTPAKMERAMQRAEAREQKAQESKTAAKALDKLKKENLITGFLIHEKAQVRKYME